MSVSTETRKRTASLFSYAILYAAFVMFRCFLNYEMLRPVTTVTLIAYTIGVSVLLIAGYLRHFRWEYIFLIFGIWIFEIAARVFGIKPLLFGEVALALCLVLLLYMKEKRGALR